MRYRSSGALTFASLRTTSFSRFQFTQLVPSTTTGLPLEAIEIGGRLPGVQSWISPASSASPASAPAVKVRVFTSAKPASLNQP